MTARRAGRLFLPVLCLIFTLLFGALGVWQVERLRWKLALIERVETRLAQPAVELGRVEPGASAEFRRVWLSGRYLHDRETLVDALTERGAGYWVITPVLTGTGMVLVNRGFVPQSRADPATRAPGQVEGPVRIAGLVRLSEPNGRFLRPNRPSENRWFSRDVAAIARARQLGAVAPMFIDAGAAPNPGGLPVGGLTVVSFRNAHLIYALTWFGLAGLSAFGLGLTLRKDRSAH